MKASHTQHNRWQEGSVDLNEEHFVLRYGSAGENASAWITVARVGREQGGVFPVQFIASNLPSDAVRMAREELQFYLVDKQERDPWHYLLYHCGTTSNLYSRIHWYHVQG